MHSVSSVVAVGVGSVVAVGVGWTPARAGIVAINVEPRARITRIKRLDRSIVLSLVCPHTGGMKWDTPLIPGLLGEHHTAQVDRT